MIVVHTQYCLSSYIYRSRAFIIMIDTRYAHMYVYQYQHYIYIIYVYCTFYLQILAPSDIDWNVYHMVFNEKLEAKEREREWYVGREWEREMEREGERGRDGERGRKGCRYTTERNTKKKNTCYTCFHKYTAKEDSWFSVSIKENLKFCHNSMHNVLTIDFDEHFGMKLNRLVV